MKSLIILSCLIGLSGCGGKAEPAKVTCLHPLIAPIPFDLLPGDRVDRFGVLHATREGHEFVVYGAFCVSDRSVK